MTNDWIEWQGGECPVVEGTPVDARHRDGEEHFGHKAKVTGGGSFAARSWWRTGDDGDITHYRVVSA